MVWKSVTVATNGLDISHPTPLPSSMSDSKTVTWSNVSTTRPAEATLLVDGTRRFQFEMLATDLPFQLPKDLEAVGIGLALYLLLRRGRGERVGTRAERLHATTVRLAATVVAIWASGTLADLSLWGYGAALAADTAVVFFAAQAAANRLAPRLRVVLCILGVLAVAPRAFDLGAAPLFVADALCLVAVTVLMVDVGYSLGLGLQGRRLAQDSSASQNLALWFGVATVVFGCLLLVADLAELASGSTPFILTTLLGLTLPFAVLFLVALSNRRTAMLLDRASDRALVALVLAEVLLMTLPYWYVGTYVSLAAVLGFTTTLGILSIGSRHSRLRAAQDVLAGVPPEGLRELQPQLVEAGQRLTRLQPALRSLEGRALTEDELDLRRSLEEKQRRLRRWPFGIEDPFKDGRPITEPADAQPPRDVDPIELALAIGPRADPVDHLVHAVRISAIMAVFPVLWFAGSAARQTMGEVNGGFRSVFDVFLAVGAREAAFWMIPTCVLAVSWGTLAGRRGSSRALQMWLCVAIPVAGHCLAVMALEQKTDTTLVLRASGVLLVLMTFGVVLDLGTLRSSPSRDSLTSQMARYFSFGRAVAVLTVVIPLLATGLTIWNEVRGGITTPNSPAVPTENVSTPNPAESP